ncbi:Uncharacterised protein [Mycobacteroides abscessus subsp. abscessus]|uniref:Uncharacterized protein n=1 Tax=Mycobacteroides abscessus subsp. bolletii TaxID=319705 RepID=A0A9Q7SH92_9MYCO|nr:hypothetical protein [Mycobacteroides abscessus]SHU55369.1 Uncharacterised protein [Mycobacteroides abscessus subsp. bolletii]SHU73573.1 Uncharacterised protein [Mycobacteroides abscessus subsp. bolletii]SHX83569.1 Uncharacterised protein [Mycobacteroides abscessus subsp. bolletii]SID82514.1 Uncharacterised protein [Mycobacteroides abscessus subsp. abscessus]SIF85399.1 Uncharacterised protein [Mycobacteroides abscessus subsp. abscessus]
MRTQEALGQRAAELAEQSRMVTARAAEALRDQWLAEPNRAHVIESKEN